MKCPEEKIYYGVICERFPEPSVYFETFDAAIRWAKSDSPAYRPYYIVECVEHYEICGIVDDKKETKEMKDENKTYEQGLADAWEAARKIAVNPKNGGFSVKQLNEIFGLGCIDNILSVYKPAEAVAKIKEYEDKQRIGKAAIDKAAIDSGYLEDWYINSIDNTIPPIWTTEHIEKLLNDFYVIPREDAKI